MRPGIEITDRELIFTEIPKKEIGLACYCKSFRINLKDIKFIALSPRLALDDEEMFLLFVNKKHHVFPAPYYYLHSGLKKIECTFDTIQLTDSMNLKFSYEEHNSGKKDKVIFPNEYCWKDLFEKDWRLIVRGLYSWIIPKSFFGTVNKELL